MPNYSFVCRECQQDLVVHCSMKEYPDIKDSVECPECGSIMKRVIDETPGIRWNTTGRTVRTGA